jgi:hypothetical protein
MVVSLLFTAITFINGLPLVKIWLLILLFWLSILGDVLVVLDLRPDESRLEAGFAREVRLC